MKKAIPFILLIGILGCSKDNELKDVLTIVGNVYIAKDRTFTDHRPLYLTYTFTETGKILIEKRLDSEKGELYDEGYGYFEYNHPELKLKIQTVPNCEKDGCFNHFDATVLDNKKSFTYQIWDISISNHRDLIFNVKQ